MVVFVFSPDSEAIGVLTSSIGGVACLRFGADMLVRLQGAAAGCLCMVPLQGAAAGCRCRVPLQGAMPLQGAAAGCRL